VFLKNKKRALPDADKLATSNLEEIKKMSSMVENLLMLARSKNNNIQTEQTKVNLLIVLESVITKFQLIANSKDISLLIERENDINNVYIYGNEKLLEQVFFNLVQNAITYTKQGSVKVKITQVDQVMIQIVDTGIGISKKDLQHIFEPFYKADTSRTLSTSGVGLGLSIVQEIVKKYSGSVEIDSEIDKGTKVTVIFPTYREKLS
jgi:signal transduction histidine kinase